MKPLTSTPRRPILRSLQDCPRALEVVYRVTLHSLLPFRNWLTGSGLAKRILAGMERVTKGAIFGCRMCGQCTLHSTGMTCPMTCPKNLRNGPCGGVRENGNCEIIPDITCVWVDAWRRSKEMPAYGPKIFHIQPMLDWRLQGSSAWINQLASRAPEGTVHRQP